MHLDQPTPPVPPALPAPPAPPKPPAPPTPPVPLPRAAWRLLRLGGLIGQGVFIVRQRFPALDDAGRQAQVQRWSQRVLRVLGVQVSLHGALAPEARMLVANHVSWLDVMVLHSVLPQARFVAKADVRQWPAVGTLVAGAGTVFVDRNRPRLARQAADEVTALMQAGALVALFAEGTTSDGHRVLPFRSGLLGAAVATGCAVQAVALRYREGGHAVSPSVPYIGDDSLAGSLWRLCRADGVAVSLRLLTARDPALGHRRHLAAQLHHDVAAALGGMPAS